jgi:hypothetical protein
VRGPQRIEALPGQAQASRKHCLTEGGEIVAGGVHAGGEALRWRGTDLYLPAGLCGKTAATRERVRRAQPGEGGGHSLLIDADTGVAAIADQPFQFDPDPVGWTGLKADPVDVLFGVALGQRLRSWLVGRTQGVRDVRAAAHHEFGPVRRSITGQS